MYSLISYNRMLRKWSDNQDIGTVDGDNVDISNIHIIAMSIN